ncbi:Holliday junction ATP-dependent DNA helicase RuvA, partial [human gut metagenome]
MLAALVQLGWNEATARQAVGAVESGAQEQGEALSVPELLRASLPWTGEVT